MADYIAPPAENIIDTPTGRFNVASQGGADAYRNSNLGGSYMNNLPNGGQEVVNPTVLSDANIRETVIPQIKSDAQKLIPSFDSSKYSLGPNGEWVPKDTASTSSTNGTSNVPSDLADLYKKYGLGTGSPDDVESATMADPGLKANLALLDSLKSSNDSYYGSFADSIRKKFQARASSLEESQKGQTAGIENALLLGGTARYAPVSASGIMSAKEKYDIQSLSELQGQEEEAVAEARRAQESGNFQLLEKKLSAIDKVRGEKNSLAKSINDKMIEENKKLKDDQYTRVGKPIEDIAKDAAKNGASAEVIKTINGSKTVQDAIIAAGDFLQAGSGIVGEYNFYKKDALAHGQTPVDFNEYQNMDANRKIKIQQAANAAGLTPALTNTALKLSDDYEAQSKNFYTVRDSFNKIQASASDPSAAGDLSLIFAYMKILDPTSVVREGEQASAQNAGSAWDRVGAQYNKVVNGQRLTEAQRKDFVNRAKQLFNASKSQQDQTRKEFSDRATKFGIPTDLVVRSTDATSAGQELIQIEDQAKSQVIQYGTNNPIVRDKISTALKDGIPYSKIKIILGL